MVYKPSTRQTFRLTYNRAFGAPSSNNLNLDILQLADLGDLGAFGQSLFGLDYIPGIGVRATGNQADSPTLMITMDSPSSSRHTLPSLAMLPTPIIPSPEMIS